MTKQGFYTNSKTEGYPKIKCYQRGGRDAMSTLICDFHQTYPNIDFIWEEKKREVNSFAGKRLHRTKEFSINPAKVEEKVLESQFKILSRAWKKETAHFSTIYHKINNENYLKILARGKDYLPFILRDLEKYADLWHEALLYITEENPVKNGDFNDVHKLREAWLKWAKENPYIFNNGGRRRNILHTA